MSASVDMATTAERLLGHVLGGIYHLEEIIATGATSVVFRSTHVRLGQPIAVKVLAGVGFSGATLTARFEAEARVQANLRHPHIVAVHDFISEGDLHAIAMEYVDGIGLDQILYELAGPMDTKRIHQIITPVLSAIGFAHECGIVHRDVKPSNIIVTSVGGRELPKVMDFGIAKVLAEGTSATAPGAMLGTLLYMSPEQCKALNDVDERADIYSLGVTLYQMATGMVPFYSESAFDIMLAHVQSDPVAPRELVPSVSESLEQVILKAIEKAPDDRFASAKEMSVAIDAALKNDIRHGSQTDGADSHRQVWAAIRPIVTEQSQDAQRSGVSGAKETDTSARPTDPSALTLDEDTSQRAQNTLPLVSGMSAPVAQHRYSRERRASSAVRSAAPASAAQIRESSLGVAAHKQSVAQDDDDLKVASSGNWPFRALGTPLRMRLRVPRAADWERYFDPNITGGGVFVPTTEPPEVGTPVQLEVLFINGPRFFLNGVTTWRRPQLKDPRARAGVGIQIHPTERRKLHYLNAWVNGTAADQRGLRRLPIKLRITYTARSGRRVNFTRDINEEGLFVRSRERLELETPVELVLVAPGQAVAFRLRGTVSRFVEDQEDSGMGISLKFTDLSERARYVTMVEELETKLLAGELPEDMLC